jgi:hypothetical protein
MDIASLRASRKATRHLAAPWSTFQQTKTSLRYLYSGLENLSSRLCLPWDWASWRRWNAANTNKHTPPHRVEGPAIQVPPNITGCLVIYVYGVNDLNCIAVPCQNTALRMSLFYAIFIAMDR